jgi:hypothetical protein
VLLRAGSNRPLSPSTPRSVTGPGVTRRSLSSAWTSSTATWTALPSSSAATTELTNEPTAGLSGDAKVGPVGRSTT